MGSFSRKLGNALAGAAEVATPAAFQVQRQNAMEARDKRLNAYNVANQKTQNEFTASEGDKTREVQQSGIDNRKPYYASMGKKIDQAIRIGNLTEAEMKRAVQFNEDYKNGTEEERAALLKTIPSGLNGEMWKATTVQTGTDPVTRLPVDEVLLQGPGGQFGRLDMKNVPYMGGGDVGGAGFDTSKFTTPEEWRESFRRGDITEQAVRAGLLELGGR
jgi:hypothetical protein